MATDDKVIARQAFRLTEVLDRLAGITAEGSLAREDLVERLESLLQAFESSSGETLEGLVQALSRHLDTLQPPADAAVVFGSAARGELVPGSDVDVLLIARNLSQLEAQAHFKRAGRELKRPVNVVVYSPVAWLAALKSEGMVPPSDLQLGAPPCGLTLSERFGLNACGGSTIAASVGLIGGALSN